MPLGKFISFKGTTKNRKNDVILYVSIFDGRKFIQSKDIFARQCTFLQLKFI